MNRVDVLPPTGDLIGHVMERLAASGADYSANLVVFPGKRPAHFLRKRIAGELKGSCLPPVIFSVDVLMEHLYRAKLGGTATRCSALDALAVLYDIHLGLGDRLGCESYVSLESFLPVGTTMLSELEDLAMAGCSAPRIRDVLSGVQFPRFHRLSEYFEAFYAELRQRGMVVRSSIYREVAGRIDEVNLDEYARIILAGFAAPTPVEQTIISGFRKRENVWLIVQQGIGMSERMPDLAAQLPEAGRPPLLPDVHFYHAPDSHGQVSALAAVLDNLLKRGVPADERIAIVLPSPETLFPVIHFALSLLPGDSYNIALGYPLERTPVVGFLGGAMDLVASMVNGKCSTREYLRFVLHPYIKNIRFGRRSDVSRMFFHALEDRLVGSRPNALFSLEELEADDDFFGAASDLLLTVDDQATPARLKEFLTAVHTNTVRRLAKVGSLGEFAANAAGVLRSVFDQSTANLHPFSQRYLEQLLELLTGIASSLLASRTFADPAGCFSFLRSLLSKEAVPFPGTPLHGVQVLGLIETRNLTFDTVFVLDATDDVLPGARREGMFLTEPVRQMLGMATDKDRQKLVEYYFDLLVRNAGTVHLFYSSSGKTEKSRYVEKLLWERQRAAQALSTAEDEQMIRYQVRLANRVPQPIQKTDAMIERIRSRTFSAQALDTYLGCHLQFYYRNVLHLRERDEASDELDAAGIGDLVHEVLAEFYRDLIHQQLQPAHFAGDRLEQIVRARCVARFGRELSGSAILLQRQMTQHLRQFFEQHQIPLVKQQHVVIKALEKSLAVEINGYRFAGRIDRIELRDNEIWILDYKTGSGNAVPKIDCSKLLAGDPQTWKEAIPSFQLPMYMLLYSVSAGIPADTIVPAYVFLGKNRLDRTIEQGIGNEEQKPTEIFRAVEPMIFTVIGHMVDSNRPFEPAADPDAMCPSCPYASICGTRWVQSRNLW